MLPLNLDLLQLFGNFKIMNILKNIKKLQKKVAKELKGLKEQGYILNQSGPIKEIGVLDFPTKCLKFTIDRDYIYANGKPIIPTCNDRLTAQIVFDEMMTLFCPDNYKSL